MSATPAPDVERTIASAEPEDVSPVRIQAADLKSTAPGYLRDLKRELVTEGHYPAALSVRACFEENCSLATQEEANRLRDYVRAATFLGAGTVTVSVDEVADRGKVQSALSACVERARREGIDLEVDGFDVAE